MVEREKCTIELQEIENAKNEYKQASIHWQNQYAVIQDILEEKTNLLANAQATIKLLSQQLTDAKLVHSMDKDQNKLLSDEKWVIAQEKAKLEGQLIQLQKMIDA